MGYEIHPVEKLQETYESSCPLRFIETWDLVCIPVPQFFEAENGRPPKIRIL